MPGTTNPQLTLPTLRTICIALIAGQLMFAGVAGYLRQSGTMGGGDSDLSILVWIASGLAMLIVPLAFILRGLRFAAAARLEHPARMTTFASGVILFFAMVEGVSLFNIIAYLLTGELLPPAAIVLVVVAIQVASLPNEVQLENAGR